MRKNMLVNNTSNNTYYKSGQLNKDGFKYNLITQEWSKTPDCSVN